MNKLLQLIDREFDNRRAFLLARLSGHLFVTLFCLAVPEVGPNRFIIAATVIGLFLPGAIIVFKLSGPEIYNPSDNYFDMICVCIGAYLSPENWHLIVTVGIFVALAPVLSASENATRRFLIVFGIMLTGMSLAAGLHNVEGWQIAIGLITIMIPPTIMMARYQARISEEFRLRAVAHDSVRLVAGGVAHDFNNLLTSILVNAEFAASTTKDADTLESLENVLKASDKAALLSKQLLSLSGRGLQHKQVINIGDEIQSVAALVKTTAAAGIPIEVREDAGPYMVQGDLSQLQQVFINLLINAAEATRDQTLHGQSSIEVRIAAGDTGRVVISVTDHGVGINRDDLTSIFEPFYSSKPAGHGLGLAAVARIVEDHDGQIEVSSEPGAGSVFTVVLPRAVQQSVAQEKIEIAPTVPTEKIIIADDDPALLSLMQRIAMNQGYDVTTATDGDHFCTVFDELKDNINMVVLDLKMPGKSGWECLAYVRTQAPELPVLIVSGFDPEEEDTPMTDVRLRYLQKPFGIKQFSSKLIETMSHGDKSI